MTPELLELASMASLLMATMAALFAYLSFLRARRNKGEPLPLTKFDAMQLLRTETDSLKAASDERERRIGKKLEDDLARLGVETNQNRDTLRKLVEDKLEDAIA